MKSLLSIVFLLSASVLFAQDKSDEVAWFDMHQCDICKGMADVEGMMQHIKWEIHKIDNGFLAVTVVPDNMKEKWAEVYQEVKATIAKVESGAEADLCGFCDSFGALVQAGAKNTEIETAGGHVQLMTSNDPKVIKRIHAHADRTIAETKKMEEMMKSHSHDDHSHDDHAHGHTHDKDGHVHEHDDHKHDHKKSDK